jgi:sugar phosphate isomerase/epimerase
MGVSRRLFLQAGSASAFSAAQTMHAKPLKFPIGLQLYTVGAEMEKDPVGTLKQVAAAGYTQVELSPMTKVTTKDLRKALDGVGLANPSGHYLLPDLMSGLPGKIEAAKELGEQYMIVTVPWVADLSRFKQAPGQGQMEFFLGVLNGLTLDDWKWNAEQFNKIGEQTRKAGLQLGYHNHNFDFKPFGETTGYDEFLRLTDPELVKLELDCGWVTVAGKDPAAYLRKYPGRYRLLHIKDFKKGFTPRTTLMDKGPNPPVPTELGRGTIDYGPIFAAAHQAKVQAVFVEQEPPFVEMPALKAIKVDYEYIHKLQA